METKQLFPSLEFVECIDHQYQHDKCYRIPMQSLFCQRLRSGWNIIAGVWGIFYGFADWGDLILRNSKIDFVLNRHSQEKCKLESLFDANLPASFLVRDCNILKDTDTMF